MADISRDQLQAEIYGLIQNYSAEENATLSDEREISTLGIDSIDLMEIVFRLEEKFGAQVDETALGSAKSLGEIIDIAFSNIQSKS